MSEFSAYRAMEEANERHEHARHSGDKLVPLVAALVAVLAALATLLAHHSSTAALSEKNTAILDDSKSASQFAYYESKRIKVHVYQALMLMTSDSNVERRMSSVARKEDTDARRILKVAQHYGRDSDAALESSERHMRTYETEEIAATLFEIGIVLVSISALASNRTFVYLSGLLCAVGLVYLFIGLLAHR